MDFALQVVGGGPETLQFSAIEGALPVGDLIAFVLHRLRGHLAATEKAISVGPANSRPKGPIPASVVLRYVSSRMTILDTDGEAVCNLDGALGGEGEEVGERRGVGGGEGRSTPVVATADSTVGVALKGIQCSPYAASTLNKRGWLYFRDLPLAIHIVCKLSSSDRPHAGSGPRGTNSTAAIRHSLASKGHCLFDIEDEGLLSMTIAEVKAIISTKVRVPALDLWIIDPEDPSGELEGDITMFRYLRTYGHITLRVVRREGIAVHVRIGPRTITMPRLRSDTTLKEVCMRLTSSFYISVASLYFDISREFPLHYFRDVSRATDGEVATPQDPIPETTCLVLLSANGSDAYLCTSPIRPPAVVVGSDNRQGYYDPSTHTTAISPQRIGRHHPSPHPRPTSAANAIAAAIGSKDPPQLTAHALAQHHHATSTSNVGGGYTHLIEPSEVPASVTAQVTLRVVDGISVGRALGPDPLVANGEAFDVVLPEEDIRTFTTEDLKNFIVSNILPQAQPSELTVALGRKVLPDSQLLVYVLSEAELSLTTATLFLSCQYRPLWAS